MPQGARVLIVKENRPHFPPPSFARLLAVAITARLIILMSCIDRIVTCLAKMLGNRVPIVLVPVVHLIVAFY